MSSRVALIGACLVLTALAAAQAPVAWWKFDETSGNIAVDSIGGVNGTLQGADAFVSGGVSGNALSNPAGTGNLVSTANAFNFVGSPFSVSAWIKTTDATSNSTIILGKHDTGFLNGWMLRVNQDTAAHGLPGKASLYTSTGASNTPTGTTTVTNGQWHHLVGTYTGSVASIYVDGQFEASMNVGGIGANSAPFLIGGVRHNGVPSNSYNGSIDDVQLYDRALSSDEIAFLFNNPGQPVPEPATLALLALGSIAMMRRRRG